MSDWTERREKKAALKMSVFKREGGHCFWCEKPITFKCSTLDHIIPISRGGKLDVGNIVLSCSPCNNERGNMPAPDYLWVSVSRRPLPTHKHNG